MSDWALQIRDLRVLNNDDRLGEAARRRAAQEGISLSAYLARLIATALATPTPCEPPPFRLITADGSGPAPGIDLDRTSALLEDDDVDTYGKKVDSR